MARGYQREFEEFVRDSSDRLVRTAYLLCGDRGHAEDIIQTALLRTARRWRSARSSPEAYARRVVVNLVKDRWRSLSRRPPETGLEVDVPMVDPVADDRLLDAVRTLPEGQQAVLVLRFFTGLSVAETAAALGCSDGTVKSQTARALDRLRSTLTPERERS
ncbi:SigE family RNA polymerase sigma factor [Cryptosporangium phraense]|uniref:SigE family RNA polymerase sigma factor n=1 Tax=Cryptosporangium phraense TaxID=2593070 RepID=A0A545APA4_9ACTN|nr:SigE family RNA polymerase sigma factor [Cryptosporangium phraense]